MKYSTAILLPTRGRTDALSRSVMSLINRAVDLTTVQLLLGFDHDDAIGIEHFQNELEPWLIDKKVNYEAQVFERLGYNRLNEYVNALASSSDADWLMFWNDDAMMDTAGWDKVIAKHTGEFKCLAVHTHNDHPYSIFPIVPREWLDYLGYLSPHQISDAWLSQQAYLLDIFERITVWVTHDRHDLTGNNNDDTYKNRVMYEGNPSDPRDFHHMSWHLRRMQDVDKLSEYMKSKNLDTSWWENIKAGTQNPWVKLQENDINNQCKQFNLPSSNKAGAA
jgi:hypothetical protein